MILDHILEYENYAGYDKTTAKIANSEVRYRQMMDHERRELTIDSIKKRIRKCYHT